jgi:hypothetical protein
MTKKRQNRSIRKRDQFVMKGTEGTHYQEEVTINYHPIKKHHKNSPAFIKFSIIPTFNADKKYCTPSFVLPFCVFDYD